MAYLKKIYKPDCRTCGRTATVELFNWRNASLGHYCAPHGSSALAERQAKERSEPT